MSAVVMLDAPVIEVLLTRALYPEAYPNWLRFVGTKVAVGKMSRPDFVAMSSLPHGILLVKVL